MGVAEAALPSWAPRLKVALPAPYVYKSALKRGAARLLDLAGGALLGREAGAIPWARLKRVAVLRLDHLGDLLNALPALARLRAALPQAELDLWVGPWGAELAGLFPMVDAVKVAPADWFARPQRREWPWGQVFGLGSALDAEGYDLGLELRGDLRHHLALWLSRTPWRAGQALTAGGFLLTHQARWDAGLHEQEQALSLLEQAGLPAPRRPWRGPWLKPGAAAEREAGALAKELKLGSAPVLVQAACGTAAKRWLPERWASLIRRLPRRHGVALLGSQAERAEMQAIASKAKGRAKVAAGRLGLAGLAAFVRRARLLLSVDSGPAHLGAVQGVRVLALYSGTNRASQWAPRGARVRVLQAPGFPCSPCELTDCPFGNACMAALDEDAVLAAAKRMLG